ncbi:MAG: DUF3343 domain-containing protein [Candidatus Desulfofervidus auxilii]|nr:DUF3343 domain-containing protein [Candidatus Desulfofervidus auxilii]
MLKQIKERLFKKKDLREKGLILVENVANAMAVEEILKEHGFSVRGVAPPIYLRKGCDLAVEFDLVEQMGIERILKKIQIIYEIVSLSTSERPLEITKTKEIDNYILIRAANMKLTIEPKTGIIVNISGGGCPDIPFLSKNLIGKHLKEANKIMENGYSLCAYMLKKALEKALKITKC